MKKFLYSFAGRLSAYLKLQIFTKILLAALLFPLFWMITRGLLARAGLGVVTNQNLLSFLFSLPGLFFVVGLFALILVALLWEILALIELSGDEQERSAQRVLCGVFRYLPDFLTSAGLLILLYLVLMVPLGGLGLTLSFLKKIGIPNFISHVIFSNPLYLSLLLTLLGVMLIFSLRWIFCFHFLVFEKLPLKRCLTRSRELIGANWRRFLKDFVGFNLLLSLFLALLYLAWRFAVSLLIQALPEGRLQLGVAFALFILQNTVVLCLTFVGPAFQIHLLSQLFWLYRGEESCRSFCPRHPRRSLLLVLLAILLMSGGVGRFFEQVYLARLGLQLVAHRAGGNLAAENSLKGLELARELGAVYGEIDIQRTKDGRYVLNHDGNFQRLSGERRSSSEMTLAEIKTLSIRDAFDTARPSQSVATLEEALSVCDERFGLFIELKGATADRLMVDEVVQMLRERELTESCFLISLDYELIQYLEERYPEVLSGYLYYLAFGDVSQLVADILIVEESAATSEMIDSIHGAEKQVFVWTVNEAGGMDRFLRTDIDGIITDEPELLQERMAFYVEQGRKAALLELF